MSKVFRFISVNLRKSASCLKSAKVVLYQKEVKVKMKKITYTLLITLMLFVSACVGQPPASEEAASEPTTQIVEPAGQAAAPTEQPSSDIGSTQDSAVAVALNTADENTVPLQVQLLLGTLKLNGTDLAVTAEQAEVLLPL